MLRSVATRGAFSSYFVRSTPTVGIRSFNEYDAEKEQEKIAIAKKKQGERKERERLKKMTRTKQKEARRKENERLSAKKQSRQQKHTIGVEKRNRRHIVESDDEIDDKPRSRKQRLDEEQFNDLQDLSKGDALF